MTRPHAVTELLSRVDAGDDDARGLLLEAIYDELRSLARGILRRSPGNETLQPTVLAHDAYMRLVGKEDAAGGFTGRRHFFSVAARAMRQLVTDHSRRRLAAKRGGGKDDWNRVTLSGAIAPEGVRDADVVALDEALERLEKLDERQARLVELRFFGGLTIEETAAELGMSATTVKDLWRGARAWLRRELAD